MFFKGSNCGIDFVLPCNGSFGFELIIAEKHPSTQSCERMIDAVERFETRSRCRYPEFHYSIGDFLSFSNFKERKENGEGQR